MRIGTRFIDADVGYFVCARYFNLTVSECSVNIITQMLTSLIKSCCKVIILSLYVPNLVQKFDRRQIYAPKTKFKMADAAILNLFPVAIFDTLPTFHY